MITKNKIIYTLFCAIICITNIQYGSDNSIGLLEAEYAMINKDYCSVEKTLNNREKFSKRFFDLWKRIISLKEESLPIEFTHIMPLFTLSAITLHTLQNDFKSTDTFFLGFGLMISLTGYIFADYVIKEHKKRELTHLEEKTLARFNELRTDFIKA